MRQSIKKIDDEFEQNFIRNSKEKKQLDDGKFTFANSLMNT